MPKKISRITSVMDQTGYSRTQIWRKSNDPDDDFPAPVQLGANSIGWFQDSIDTYLESRPRGHLTQTPKLAEYWRGQRKQQQPSEAKRSASPLATPNPALSQKHNPRLACRGGARSFNTG